MPCRYGLVSAIAGEKMPYGTPHSPLTCKIRLLPFPYYKRLPRRMEQAGRGPLRTLRHRSQLHRYNRQTHVGNMRSRCAISHHRRRKPDRHRDTDFEAARNRAEMLTLWDKVEPIRLTGWADHRAPRQNRHIRTGPHWHASHQRQVAHYSPHRANPLRASISPP